MVAMKKCCLFLLLLLCFTTSKAVEPWSGIANHYLWSSLIPYQKEVFPINNEKGVATIPFFKNPDGEILNIEIPKMNEVWYDYKNEIVKVFDCDLIPTGIVSHGTWMQIDVSYPHDEGQDDFECHRIRCWIRYLDDSGHPLVWYHTRD